ncbi:metallophosphoesterase family protein [Sphingomonas sp. Leaf4]|uniref:metallophosphoesterase family protein n=1 Tax=Sphingomonas sp. Leaf4 TaxID=2876553 RepID=UPI001E2F8199|nr:metallophosphoesterase family protein [Sphingomonas sp. Leaf4]
MFKRLFGQPKRTTPASITPEGTRIYAIGDVHGMRRELDVLLDRIMTDDAARGQADRLIVFLGDLVDRGPDSAGVVERCRTLADSGIDAAFLMGNHEEVMLSALEGDREALRLFARIGGRETMLSYGVSEADYDLADFDELHALLVRCVPQSHRDFLAAGEDFVVRGDYAFVHAGIRPNIPIDRQRPSDLRWMRSPFLEHARPHEKIIVHGHTVTEEPEFRDNRIGIDTGAYRTGVLTALGLGERDRWIVQNV